MRTITVVVPPFEKRPDYLDGLKSAFPDAVRRVRGHAATPTEVTAAFSNIFCERCDNLDASTPVGLVRKLRSNSAAVVIHGALYRTAGVELRRFDRPVPDDIWTPHLHALGQAIGEAAAAAEGYVVVDAGVFNPSRTTTAGRDLACWRLKSHIVRGPFPGLVAARSESPLRESYS